MASSTPVTTYWMVTFGSHAQEGKYVYTTAVFSITPMEVLSRLSQEIPEFKHHVSFAMQISKKEYLDYKSTLRP